MGMPWGKPPYSTGTKMERVWGPLCSVSHGPSDSSSLLPARTAKVRGSPALALLGTPEGRAESRCEFQQAEAWRSCREVGLITSVTLSEKTAG